MCEYCDKRKNIKINPSPLHKEDQPDSAVIMDGGMVLFKNHLAFGSIDFDYCPMCGRKLVEKCVNELEFAPEWDGHKPEDVDRLLSLCFDKY